MEFPRVEFPRADWPARAEVVAKGMAPVLDQVRTVQAVAKVFRMEQKKSTPTAISSPDTPSFFYIKSERQYIKIQLEEILYIESLRNHVRIITKDKKYTTLLGISQIEAKLPPQSFMRVHRSFVVALSQINQFSHGQVIIGEKVPKTYREDICNS